MSEGTLGDKVQQLRERVVARLGDRGVFQAVRDLLVADSVGKDNSPVMRVFKERELLENLLASLRTKTSGRDGAATSQGQETITATLRKHPNSFFLQLKLQSGRSFFQFAEKSDHRLFVVLSFHNQRLRSRSVPARVDPAFDDEFLLRLPYERSETRKGKNGSETSDVFSLLRQKEPIRILVFQEDSFATVTFIGSHSLVWRRVLKQGVLGLSLELGGGQNFHFPKGILNLSVELYPRTQTVTEEALKKQLTKEKELKTKQEREFYLLTKKWYAEFLEVHESFSNRFIRMYATTENGEPRSVCSFVRPMTSSIRFLSCASEVCRFVSLYPLEASKVLNTDSVWHSALSMFSKKSGTAEDHVLLLCSLLLGFSMDVFVGIGTGKAGRASMCVLYRRGEQILFFDAVRGTRDTLASVVSAGNFRTIDCVFNDVALFANIQKKSNYVGEIAYDFENTLHWKRMEIGSAQKVLLRHPPLRLLPPTPDPILLAETMERSLRQKVEMHRKVMHLSTVWHGSLSDLLAPALYAYEMERKLSFPGREILNDFTASVKTLVPPNHTFEGFPLFSSSVSVDVLFHRLKQKKVCLDILQSKGDSVRFGLRVKVFAYPEDIASCWIFLAVSYLDTNE